jgi:predicted acetyltransferase
MLWVMRRGEKGRDLEIELRRPERSERELIRRMLQLYMYDFSEYEDEDLDEHGLFTYGDLDYFWFEPTHAAFLVTVDGKLGGFVLVSNEVTLEESERLLAEFFVVRKYRRQGVGREVARKVFDSLPGRWEVHVIERNVPAQAFWRQVVAEYTRGNYVEKAWADDEWRGLLLTFTNSEP